MVTSLPGGVGKETEVAAYIKEYFLWNIQNISL